MNKTIIANISGTIFHIEEDAYEALKNYLADVTGYFSSSADSFEIVRDIEQRIAELFMTLLQQTSKQVITRGDVASVTSQIGTPADFEVDASSGSEREKDAVIQRRLFRASDDKIVAGVCAGLAHYFDVDPVWIRIGWLVLSFAGGLGFISYMVLWIIVPVAQSRADKLAMNGKAANLNSIKESVQGEVNSLKQNLNRARNNVHGFQVGGAASEVSGVLSRMVLAVFRITRAFLGALLTFIGAVCSFAFFTSLFVGWLDVEKSPLHAFPFSETRYPAVSFTFLVVTLIIPAMLLTSFGIRIFFRKNTVDRNAVRVLLALWLVAFGITAALTAQVATKFKCKASFEEQVAIKPVRAGTYYLHLAEGDSLVKGGKSSVRTQEVHFNIFQFDNGFRNQLTSDISVKLSDGGSMSLEKRLSAYGASAKDAAQNASHIQYLFNQRDSVLNFPLGGKIKDDDSYRGQSLRPVLHVPLNATLIIDPLLNVNVPDEDDFEFSGKKNVWVMTDSGLVPKFGHRLPE